MAPSARPKGVLDILLALGFVLAGALAVEQIPAGDWLRLVLVAPVLFFAPGYLLIEAMARPHETGMRLRNAFIAVGVSPAFVGMLALFTATTKEGFSAGMTVSFTTIASVALGAWAISRRLAARRRLRAPKPSSYPLVPARPQLSPAPEPVVAHTQGTHLLTTSSAHAQSQEEKDVNVVPSSPISDREPESTNRTPAA